MDMNIGSTIYERLPEPVKPLVERGYYRIVDRSAYEDLVLHSEFVDDFFHSRDEYERYVAEFENGPASDLRSEALREYERLTGERGLADIGLNVAQDYYAVTRKVEPVTVIETGVCNGISTLSVLLGIRENGFGNLYSIDYPLRANESLQEFRKETFEDYGGAAIPRDKEPGWIVPEGLRASWDLTIGKSQRELPRLITDLETVDLFLHDSEHSHPCMMFEFELAYEWMTDGGVILSDDISWNDAFSVFVEVRKPEYGKLSDNIGYVKKPD
jgi:predicted O-methyltransferase YrrM